METITQNELISEYANARDKEYEYTGEASKYWAGVKDAYKTILGKAYPKWASTKIGFRVFIEGRSYATALTLSKHPDLAL